MRVLLAVLAIAVGVAYAGPGNDTSPDCIICGLLINEVEALMAENLTLSHVEAALRKDFCGNRTGAYATTCDTVIAMLPVIVKTIDGRDAPGRVCVNLKICPMPFNQYKDPIPAPIYTVNLDLPPNQRWKQICAMPEYSSLLTMFFNAIDGLLPNHGKDLENLGADLNNHYFPAELSQEIAGCAAAAGVPEGWLAIINIGYEISDACTSMIAQTTSGQILHARNLDFWDGWGFTDILRNLTLQAEMQTGGQTLFHLTTLAGYVGALSGQRPGAYSMTIDTRFYPNGFMQMFYEVIAAIKERNASLVSFLTRDILQNTPTFSAALTRLETTALIADVYYIIAGTQAGEGAVVTRNRTTVANLWMLDSPTRWFEVETNYDHWKPPLWIDDRRGPANNMMNAIGQANISLTNMFHVLSTKPVLNLQTTHTILSCPATGEYHSFRRFCNFPCVE